MLSLNQTQKLCLKDLELQLLVFSELLISAYSDKVLQDIGVLLMPSKHIVMRIDFLTFTGEVSGYFSQT